VAKLPESDPRRAAGHLARLGPRLVGYFHLAEERRNIFGLEGWIRRHIRACFWQRWDHGRGRLRKLRTLGLSGRLLQVAHRSQGAWRIAASPSLQTALSNAALRRYGFWMPSDLAATV